MSLRRSSKLIFRYNTNRHYLFENVSFQIEKNKTLSKKYNKEK
jgi:hypothetical protein